MQETQYIDLTGISQLQRTIMIFIDDWVHTENTPVPRSAIVAEMKKAKIKNFTVFNALNELLKKGYLRRAGYYGLKNKTYYVQLRRVSH